MLITAKANANRKLNGKMLTRRLDYANFLLIQEDKFLCL